MESLPIFIAFVAEQNQGFPVALLELELSFDLRREVISPVAGDAFPSVFSDRSLLARWDLDEVLGPKAWV
jgi:hypothetical protein